MSRKVSLDLERSPVGVGIRKIGQWVTYDQFVDGEAADGTLNLSKQIPAGSVVLFSKVTVKAGFTGDGSCVLDIGTADDADAFSYTTHNIYTAASNLLEHADVSGAGTSPGPVLVTSDTTVKLTASSGSDWTSVSAGKIYVEVVYLSTNPEVIDQVATRYDG